MRHDKVQGCSCLLITDKVNENNLIYGIMKLSPKGVFEMTNIRLQIIDKSHKEILRNLFNLYQHDLSKIDASLFPNVDQRGFYDYETVEEYFNHKALHDQLLVYLIICEGNVAGFCVITKAPYVKQGCDYCIQEFFIIGSYRKKGIASETCKVLFNKYPGRYCLEVLAGNIKAKFFWRKIADTIGTEFTSEKDDTVFTFLV